MVEFVLRDHGLGYVDELMLESRKQQQQTKMLAASVGVQQRWYIT